MTAVNSLISSQSANAYSKATGSTASGSSSGSSSSSSSTTSAATDPLANESTFLQLLVSQLKNQDPASPMDGTTFVTQLAQFSDLEQNLAMRNDLDSINSKYTGTATTTTTGTGDGSSGTQQNGSSTQGNTNPVSS